MICGLMGWEGIRVFKILFFTYFIILPVIEVIDLLYFKQIISGLGVRKSYWLQFIGTLCGFHNAIIFNNKIVIDPNVLILLSSY